jgi:hypothetical protein
MPQSYTSILKSPPNLAFLKNREGVQLEREAAFMYRMSEHRNPESTRRGAARIPPNPRFS